MHVKRHMSHGGRPTMAGCPDPLDLSPLLFRPPSADPRSAPAGLEAPLPYVGPVRVARGAAAGGAAIVHGRGLVATRAVSQGECLMVIAPAASADVAEVRRLWEGGGGRRSAEEVAEASLLKAMGRCAGAVSAPDPGPRVRARARAAASFLALASSHEEGGGGGGGGGAEDEGLLDVLLGRSDPTQDPDPDPGPGRDRLLGIVRSNAFGPDYHGYDRIEREWSRGGGGSSSSSSCSSDDGGPYRRILGLYPLAAMINHSCHSNAVRVFSGEVMAVHASAAIGEGEEVLWSYLPACQPYRARQEQAEARFGFLCRCRRCLLEGEALSGATEEVAGGLDELGEIGEGGGGYGGPSELRGHMERMELLLSHPSLLPGGAGRSLRLGLAGLSIGYFNAALRGAAGPASPDGGAVRRRVLDLAGLLHLSFCASNHGSTEHLSVLHLCYELAGTLEGADDDGGGDGGRRRKFWAEQLRRAHLVRYGALGGDLSSMREAMRHSRGVLRNLDGLREARWGFV